MENQDLQIKCPKCNTLNRPNVSFCANCGKTLKGKRPKKKKKRKIAKKLLKGSKHAVKSTKKKGIRKTAKKETLHLIHGIDHLLDGKLSKLGHHHAPKYKKNEYGYLICNRCRKYYKLDKNIKAEDFKVCTCGGELSFTKTIYSN